MNDQEKLKTMSERYNVSYESLKRIYDIFTQDLKTIELVLQMSCLTGEKPSMVALLLLGSYYGIGLKTRKEK